MCKTCIICNDGIKYKDNIGKCPKCNNYLRKIDKEELTYNDFEEDPYKSYEEDLYETYKEENNYDNKYNYQSNDSNIDYENTFLYGNKNRESTNKINEDNLEKRKELKDKKSNHVCISGIAHKILKENKEEKGFEKFTTFFERSLNSLINFAPYPLTNDIVLFQLYYDEGFGSKYEDIIVRGRLDSSQITEGNYVEVRGKRNRKGEIVASSIHKRGSNVTVKPSFVISPIIVWIILLAIIYGVYKIVTIDWGLIFGIIFSFLFQIIFIVCFFWIIFKMLIKSIFGK